MNYLLFLLFGVAPSLFWLAYYLRKDLHPEPKRKLLKIFLLGMVATVPAILLEIGIGKLLPIDTSHVFFVLYVFLGVALIEEVTKYLTFAYHVADRNDREEVDEPVDLMEYLITAALGFAAMENILVLFGLGLYAPLGNILTLTLLRSGGAVLLHALASATIGYFVALSFYQPRRKLPYLLMGVTMATVLHGLFNLYILEGNGIFRVALPLVILISLAVFVSLAFRRLQSMKSVTTIR